MHLFSIPLLAAAFLYSTLLFLLPIALYFLMAQQTTILEWTILPFFSSPMTLPLILDPYGLLFSCTVLFISANVIIFAHSYIMGDPFIARFIHLVLLFVISINLLIYIPHLIALLLGWDGLGLTSFLLVIYYQNPKSLAAGIITALTNRIGDVLLLIRIGWYLNTSHWNILLSWESPYSNIFGVSILLAAITKSAQLPFSRWLPAAMAAPTPVSALVHSSTLVTAGVFLLFRFYPSLSITYLFNKILIIIATLTALIAGLSAITECDIKKIIALSTLRQLGVIIISLGLGAPLLAFFHLITHALFKALLFLCAGTLIHLHHHSQDLRFIGQLTNQIPLITSCLAVSNLALCGAPFLAGFYSKDLILEFSLFSPTNTIIILLFFFATGLTASYSIRFIVNVVLGPSSSLPLHATNDQDLACSWPTIFLSTAAIIGGACLNWLVITPQNEAFLPNHLKGLTIFVTLLGLFSSWYINTSTSSSSPILLNSHSTNTAICQIWFLTPLSSQHMLIAPFFLSHQFTKTLDQGWEEICGGQGTLIISSHLSSALQLTQKNIIGAHLTIRVIIIFPIVLLIYI